MNLSDTVINFLGLVIILLFLGLVIIFAVAGRSRPGRNLRELSAFTRLRRAAGLAIEEGTRLRRLNDTGPFQALSANHHQPAKGKAK